MIVSRSTTCPYCGSDHMNSCYITYHDGAYCFSCGKGTKKSEEDFAFRPKELVSERRELFTPANTLNVNEFSPKVLSWLYSYFVYDNLIRDSRIAYSPATEWYDESLLFPVSNTEYQRRFFPKAFFSTSGVKQTVFVCGSQTANTVVLVEDYVSAIRVGQSAPTLCLFGTSCNKLLEQFIIQNYTDIYIWLDNDEPGINAAKKIEEQLTKAFHYKMLQKPFTYQQVARVCNISTELQPKEYSDNQIKEIFRYAKQSALNKR